MTEAFLKLYAAYRTEENFVCIIPQSNRLKLMLNMPYADLLDAKGICRDVTNLSHWATGDVEIDFDDLVNLHYVMGLVRQAYEWRIGEGADA